MIKKLLLGALALVLIAGLLVQLSLRDNPAVAANGERLLMTRSGQSLEVYRHGPPQGPVVVLLASFARSVSDFNALAQSLADAGFQTIRLEARGVGGSSLPESGPLLFDYAEDLAFVLDSLSHAEPVALVGHAFGNRVARAFAARYPERVSQLVLLAAGDSAPPPETRNAIFTVMLSIMPEGRREEALKQAFFAPGATPPDAWMRGWYPRAGLAQAYATANTPKAQWVHAGSDTPISILQPEHDAAAQEGGHKLKQQLPDRVAVVALAGAGHAILPEQPEQVAQFVLAQLEREVVR
ncbi:alpha/beta fold hydrolase [Litorivivens sp.]|uniref:alpha/beta fold hydrolase n=1 Tax=Litorivivens sp. TaxID=2020868 RepID=UPI003562ECDD